LTLTCFRIWRPIIKKQQSQLGNEIVVTTSASGAAAIQKLQQHQPNLVSPSNATSGQPNEPRWRSEAYGTPANPPMNDTWNPINTNALTDSSVSRLSLREDIAALRKENDIVRDNISNTVREFEKAFYETCSRGDYLTHKLKNVEDENKELKEANMNISKEIISVHAGRVNGANVRKRTHFSSAEALCFEESDSKDQTKNQRSAFKRFEAPTSWPRKITEFSVGFFAGSLDEDDTSKGTPVRLGAKETKKRKKRTKDEDAEKKPKKTRKKDKTEANTPKKTPKKKKQKSDI
jgi:hypothetical protein